MKEMSVFFAILFYVATIVLVVGLALRIKTYVATPTWLKIPVTPAPLTKSGVAFRLFREVAFFESLFKSNRWIWIFAVLFHAGLALVILRHVRYFQADVWLVIELAQPFGIYGGMAMVAGLLGLWARRVVQQRIRYISGVSDHLMLALLVLIGVSGLSMKFVAHTDIIQVKAFFLGLMRFNIQELPADPNLMVHLVSVAVLMMIFPFSKLLHVAGVFFAPSRAQVDDAREKRHLAPWAAFMDDNR
ncbi:MAG: respiratory nitrate reductase subunit gamma [Alphaproteobacteria bacterium]|nr:respiratory nitrate reductase subunit gamma [Alphaproteobacteria bacterium]MBF0250236.1 respiratory nitrate reductase subunit gamma [Alphaproteobacteria bacterium]